MVTTNVLPFHLVTLPESKPGILITPPANGIFAEFTCGGFLKSEVEGNGIIGTITTPACGASATQLTIAFEGTKGVQKHKKVAGTATEYHLISFLNGATNGEQAAHSGSAAVHLLESEQLECT